MAGVHSIGERCAAMSPSGHASVDFRAGRNEQLEDSARVAASDAARVEDAVREEHDTVERGGREFGPAVHVGAGCEEELHAFHVSRRGGLMKGGPVQLRSGRKAVGRGRLGAVGAGLKWRRHAGGVPKSWGRDFTPRGAQRTLRLFL